MIFHEELPNFDNNADNKGARFSTAERVSEWQVRLGQNLLLSRNQGIKTRRGQLHRSVQDNASERHSGPEATDRFGTSSLWCPSAERLQTARIQFLSRLDCLLRHRCRRNSRRNGGTGPIACLSTGRSRLMQYWLQRPIDPCFTHHPHRARPWGSTPRELIVTDCVRGAPGPDATRTTRSTPSIYQYSLIY